MLARNYLVNEKPDVIINIIDATNIERNLYLTTQLSELNIPMVIALNMIDVTRKNGDVIQLKKLAEELKCEVIETSALKGEGSKLVAEKAAALAHQATHAEPPHVFAGSVEHTLAHIEDLITHRDGEEPVHHHHADGVVHEGSIVDPSLSRWYAIKLFERDEKVLKELNLSQGVQAQIEKTIAACEAEMDDDAESIITNQRYAYINRLVSLCVKKGKAKGSLTASDKIDRIVTNRVLALPIFAVIMFLVYYISVTTIGALVTDFTNDTFVGEWVQAPLMNWLDEHRHGGLAGRADRRRHHRRRGRGAWLRAPDAGAVPDAGDFGRRRLYGARRVHHGPHFPPVRAFGQELYPDADRFGLRHSGRDGLAHH